jgi:hypothetical protein
MEVEAAIRRKMYSFRKVTQAHPSLLLDVPAHKGQWL